MMTQEEFKKLIELDQKLSIEGKRLFKILKEYGIFFSNEGYETTEWNIEEGLTIQTFDKYETYYKSFSNKVIGKSKEFIERYYNMRGYKQNLAKKLKKEKEDEILKEHLKRKKAELIVNEKAERVRLNKKYGRK